MALKSHEIVQVLERLVMYADIPGSNHFIFNYNNLLLKVSEFRKECHVKYIFGALN